MIVDSIKYLGEPVRTPRLLTWLMEFTCASLIVILALAWLTYQNREVPQETEFSDAQVEYLLENYPEGHFKNASVYTDCIGRVRWFFDASGEQYTFGGACWWP